jgi:redox-sensing transcriptional repressor
LTVPAGVDVRKVDLSVELQVLAFLDQQRDGSAPVVAALRADAQESVR